MNKTSKSIVVTMLATTVLGVQAVLATGAVLNLGASSYTPGADVTVMGSFAFDTNQDLLSLEIDFALPAGWTATGVTGVNGCPTPDIDTSAGIITYDGFYDLTNSPIAFALTLHAPADATGAQSLGSQVGYWPIADDNPLWINGTPSPLILHQQATTLTINPSLGTYDGTAKTPTVTTVPADLTVSFTYNGSSVAPINAGSYTVVATIVDSDWGGCATQTCNISQKALTVSGITAASTIYDGTTTAKLGGTAAFQSTESAGAGSTGDGKPYSVDSVSAGGTAAGTLAAKDVGTQDVTITGVTVTGTGNGNYTATQQTGLTQQVTAKALTVSGITAASTVYDGTTTAKLGGTAAFQSTESAGAGSTGDGKPYSVDSVSAGGAASGALAAKDVGTQDVTITGVTVTGTGFGNYTATQQTGLTQQVTAKALTVSGITAASTVYDGTTTAKLTGAAAFQSTESAGAGSTGDGKPYSVDSVSAGGAASGALAAKDVGTQDVTITGVTVTGTGFGNYTATQQTGLTQQVTAKALTVSGITAASTVYDGTTTAKLTGAAAFQSTESAGAGTTGDGKPYSVDSVSAGGTAAGTLAAKDVGTQAVTITGVTVTGTGFGNYTATQQTGLTQQVTAKALTVSGITAASTIYDGTTTAKLGGTAAFQSTESAGAGSTGDGKPYSVDSVSAGGTAAGTLAAKDVGTQDVTITGVTVTGTGNGNYTATQQTGLTQQVTAKALTVSGITAASTVYDGTTTAKLGGTAAFQSTESAGAGSTGDGKPYSVDSVSAGGTAAGTLAAKDVGTQAVTITGVTVTGTGNGNYTVTQQTGLTQQVTPKTLTVVLIAPITKVYDGNNTATLVNDNYQFTGLVLSEMPVMTQLTGTYATTNVGTGIAVSTTLAAGDFTEAAGFLKANYTLPTSAAGDVGEITIKGVTITADAKVIQVGNSLPTLTYTTVPSLVNGDGFTGGLACDTTPGTVGTYPITQNDLSAGGNYSITYAGANLVIVDIQQTGVDFRSPGTAMCMEVDFIFPDGVLTNLVWTPALPTGWTLISATNAAGALSVVGNGVLLTAAGGLGASPLTFWAAATVPGNQVSIVAFTNATVGMAFTPASGSLITSTLAMQNEAVNWRIHSADYRPLQWVIDATEMNRVLAYWRGGGYHLDAAGYDGYAPGFISSANVAGALHSADYDGTNGVISAAEAARVIAYWHDGGYHPDATGYDGYASGAPATFSPLLAPLDDPAPPGATVTQTGPAEYDAGGTVTVNCTLNYTGQLLSMSWIPVLPSGWQILSVSGAGSPELQRGEVLWTSGSALPNPLVFTYTAQVPVNARGTVTLGSQAQTMFHGLVNPLTVSASQPLTMTVITDANGIATGWEMYYFGATDIDPLADPDGDGMNNLQEYLAGTDPNDSQSLLVIQSLSAANGKSVLNWQSASNRTYTVEAAATPAGPFTSLATGIVSTPPANTMEFDHDTGVQFLRVMVEDP